jgi:hypothetical protein
MRTEGQARGQTGGRTDRHDKANSRSSQFLDRTNKCGAIFYELLLVHGSKARGDTWLERLQF